MFKDVMELIQEPEQELVSIKEVQGKNVIFDNLESYKKMITGGVIFVDKDGNRFALGDTWNYIYDSEEEKNGNERKHEKRNNLSYFR